jgi:uncharacterized membrane protein
MKSIKLIIVLMLGVALFISCDSRTQQDLEGIVTNPTYTKNIKPIMDSKCVNCHSQNGQGNYPDLDTYNAVKSAQDGTVDDKLLCSILSSTCTSDRMPKSDAPLSNGTINTIKNWIDNGYPEN